MWKHIFGGKKTMNLVIKKWGNSLAVILPKQLALLFNIKENTRVKIEVTENKIILVPIEDTLNLSSLLSGITNDNLHNELANEGPIGNEAW